MDGINQAADNFAEIDRIPRFFIITNSIQWRKLTPKIPLFILKSDLHA